MAEADAAFIVALRKASGKYLHRGAASEAEQRTWIARYFTRPDDYYFVVERNDDRRPEGLVGIYDVDRVAHTAEWGRFVLQPGSCAAVETALLVYRCGFEVLGLDLLRCRTLAGNVHVVAFHDSCGLHRVPAPVMVANDDAVQEAVEHVLSRGRWPAVRDQLDRLAARLARPARDSNARER